MDNRNMINRVLVKRYYIKLQSKNKSDVVDEAYDFLYTRA